MAALTAAAVCAAVLVACGSGLEAATLVERATGTWDCTVRFGDDTNEVTAEVGGDGTYTLTAGDDRIDGTWERSGDEVSITSDSPFIPGFTYQGATDDPEELTVVEDAGVSGVFDVDLDGDRVVFTQTEYGDGQPALSDFPVVYTCDKQ